MRLTVQYRDSARGAWKPSAAEWMFEDIRYLNRACGYDKYRIVKVTAV